ncbi:venom carboxylesterase-6-like [Tribolium madens]|uniref:venom carboxylesterase-6-like n=1 Tax=Tribolium madens TaxID=41895 RepID=UPI001CF73B7B|nr:venom carboxylesterase-6-like [Tribolium madens]
MLPVVLLVLGTTLVAANAPQVTLPDLGQLEGTRGTSLKGRTFYKFEGVPYARPPVGKYRFREPVSPKPWQGIWQAKILYKCMQNFQYTPPGGDFVIGDEDCLYLNIYSPNVDPNANLDVIFFIHGGCFMFNYAGFQGPEYLLDKDVVYVSINYRLGPLGFLSTEDEVVPGNNGMKDQIFALEFVKKYIRYFGGNPDSVTISGMSAGGASVHFHYLSPKSRGLYHRGISQSGTMLNQWVLTEKPLEKAKKLAALLGCGTKRNDKMVECLKWRPGRQIVAAVKDFQPWLYNPYTPFGPVVDSWAQDPVLPEHPYILIKKKKITDLPWLASYTSSEGLYPASDFYIDEQYLEDIDTRWNEIVPFILDYNYTVEPQLRDEVSQKIRKYYLGNKKVSRSTFMDFVKITSDRVFVNGIYDAIRMQVPQMTSPVYSYFFEYRGAHSRSESRTGTNKNFGAAHGDDTAYVFKTTVDTASTEGDRKMVELLVDIFTSFAKNGVPKVPIDWPPVSKNSDSILQLKIAGPNNLSLIESKLKNGDFWRSLPLIENEKLFENVKDEL